jgi:UDP-N-acetylmuramoylalanine--D-glutamate ligase
LSSMIRQIKDLRGIKATVMGLGLNGGGLASARFLAEHGAEVTVTDMKDEAALTGSISALSGLPIRYVLGKHELADFSGADLVVKNPAVRPDSPYLLASKAVETDISLFLRFSTSPILAVTGSKGKSSVSSAIHHILVSSGKKALLGGNITVSPLSFLDECGPDAPVVLELSSWQLADLRGLDILKPKVAVLTSIMPDHMNRYSSMEEYVDDKRLIYADQDDSCFTVCNADDTWGHSFAAQTRARVFWYSGGTEAFPPGGPAGAWIDPLREDRGFYSSSWGATNAVELVPEHILVPGGHQRRNLLAAALSCAAYGLDPASISLAVASFPGVEHRLEHFAEKDGIAWYNDSAATIPQAVGAALDSFDGPIILITGGTDKNLDFEPLRSVYKKAKSLIFLAGSGTNKLIPLIKADGLSYFGPYDDLELAVAQASKLAKSGDTVLLSPGCTSFGMFLHEFDRGRKFKEITRKIIGS